MYVAGLSLSPLPVTVVSKGACVRKGQLATGHWRIALHVECSPCQVPRDWVWSRLTMPLYGDYFAPLAPFYTKIMLLSTLLIWQLQWDAVHCFDAASSELWLNIVQGPLSGKVPYPSFRCATGTISVAILRARSARRRLP